MGLFSTTMGTILGTTQSGAIFSDDARYRYRLWRCWDVSLPRVLFILLNPSKADEADNDPTIERQYRRVVSWGVRGLIDIDLSTRKFPRGFGTIEVVNACAWRSTDPEALYHVEDPIGDENGEHISDACRQAVASGGIIVCGWGSHLIKLSAGQYVLHDLLLESLQEEHFPLSAFKLNSDGTPRHPLYLSYDLKPRRWSGGELREEAV